MAVEINWRALRPTTAVLRSFGAAALKFLQSGTGAVERSAQDKMREIVNAADFGAVGDGVTDDAAAINAAIVYVASLGGGEVHFKPSVYAHSATIDVKYPRVRLVGAGVNSTHDNGVESARTIFKSTFAGTSAKIRTPYASEQGIAAANAYKYTGAGIVGVTFDGNNIGTKALEVDSVSWVDVNVHATGFVGTDVFQVKCGVTGTDLGEPCDVQHSRMIFSARQIDSASQKLSNILRLSGSSNANVSVNRGPMHGIAVVCHHWTGDALIVESADNNDISVTANRAGGAGRTVYCKGPTASIPVGADSNTFRYVSGAGAVFAEGTDTGGVTAGIANLIENLDTGNGTPTPTKGTASTWEYHRPIDNVTGGAAFMPMAFAGDSTNAKSERAALTTETLRISNGSGNHVVLTDGGTNQWGVHIDGPGNLRINRVAGSGAVTLGNGANVNVGGRLQTTSSSGSLGYATGAGGTVAQATSRTTGVTLSKTAGQFQLFSTTTTAGQTTTFTLTNTVLSSADGLVITQATGSGVYFASAKVGAGSAVVSIYTPAAVGVAEAPIFNFQVVSGANA